MAFQFPANPVIGQEFSPTVGVTYKWNGTGWGQIGPNPASLYPPGVVVPYAGVSTGGSLPFLGWLICDGKSFPTVDYPGLFAVIGFAFGGAGANFNVPDLRGRVVAGIDNMGGGTAAGRMTPLLPRGGTRGTQDVALSVPNLATHNHVLTDPQHNHTHTEAAHNHTITDPGHTHDNPVFTGSTGAQVTVDRNASGLTAAAAIPTASSTTGITVANRLTGITNNANSTGITLANTGSGTAHENVQPSLMLNYIIKT